MKKRKRLREKEEILLDSKFNIDESVFAIKANRQLSSKWTVQVKVNISVTLEDGRVLVVSEIRNLPAKQIGRKEKKQTQSLMETLDEAGLLEDKK